MSCCKKWPPPTAVIADGPYGLGKFPDEMIAADNLSEWYAPHIAEWARLAQPETAFWLW